MRTQPKGSFAWYSIQHGRLASLEHQSTQFSREYGEYQVICPRCGDIEELAPGILRVNLCVPEASSSGKSGHYSRERRDRVEISLPESAVARFWAVAGRGKRIDKHHLQMNCVE